MPKPHASRAIQSPAWAARDAPQLEFGHFQGTIFMDISKSILKNQAAAVMTIDA